MLKALIPYLIVAVVCGVAGYLIKSCPVTDPVIIEKTDTVKIEHVEFVPDIKYVKQKINIDSITAALNKFWKDSLQSLYGMGLFSAKAKTENEYGKREAEFKSRIPIDPEGFFIFNDSLSIPVIKIYSPSTFGIHAGLSNNFTRGGLKYSAGIKYYFVDKKHFSIVLNPFVETGVMDVYISGLKLNYNFNLTAEVKF